MDTTADFSEAGPRGAEAAAAPDLPDGSWYSPRMQRTDLRGLAKRTDGPATRDTFIWIAMLVGSGYLAWLAWPTLWAIPAFFLYGTIYASGADSRAHEAGHGTPFKTPWKNVALFELSSFMVLRESTRWQWSHARHHTDTIITGRDPEIAVPRPPDIVGIILNFFNLKSGIREFGRIAMHCFGKLTEREESFIPESERPKVFHKARIWLAIFAAVGVLAAGTQSILPLLYVGLPSFYGAWLHHILGMSQHAGLQENVLDHRLNTRTILLNPLFRFLYSNMNFHLEHHLFPMVPYHALPKLHEHLKDDLPRPYPGLVSTYAEIIPAVLRQRRDPSYFVQRRV